MSYTFQNSEQFQQYIIHKFESTGATRLSVIFDGNYLVSSKDSKMIYVRLQKNSKDDEQGSLETQLQFFVHKKDKPKDVEIFGIVSQMMSRITSNVIYNLEFPLIDFTVENCTINVDLDLNLLIIESGIYNTLRNLAIDPNYRNKIHTINGVVFDDIQARERINTLVDTFKNMSFSKFREIIYSKNSMKFISRINKYSNFYRILKGFVPVFIEYKYLYNPLLDDPTLDVESLNVYKVALDKGRFVGDKFDLKAYMLTHEEICLAFKMTNFVRFTPSFFYDILVGLLRPQLDLFPSTKNTIYVRPDNVEINVRLNSSYSKNNFNALIIKLRDKMKNENSANPTKDQERLKALGQYVERNSLVVSCEKNYNILTTFGPSVLDQNVKLNPGKLYEYLSKARL